MRKPYGENCYFTDEMRYGTRTQCKRRWTVQGDRPTCPVKLGYEWSYLYVALCPFSGDVFAMLFTHLDKECFNGFLKAFNKHLQDKGISKNTLLVGDGATAHTSQDWDEYPTVDWQRQPTACPELNPVERFFEEIRRHTGKLFKSLEEIEHKITELVNEYIRRPEKVSSLTLFPYIKCTD